MRIRIFVAFGVSALMLGGVMLARGVRGGNALQANPKAAARGMWNGGKPSAPVIIESSINAPIAPDQDTHLVLTLTPTRDCAELTTEVRGIDGAAVSGDTARSHGQCIAGRGVVHPVTARVPQGVAGYAVVTVNLWMDGERYSEVRAFPLEARGGARHAAKLAAPDARIALEPDGSRSIVMQGVLDE
jgi:hypothetical protein